MRAPHELSRSRADSWDRRLGAVWARVLRAAEGGTDGVAIELGPGFSAKVGHGLHEVGFRGELLLVEPNREAREFVVHRYRELLPRAQVSALAEVGAHRVTACGRVDLLLANHLLDDVLLRRMLSPVRSDALFAEMLPGASCTAAFVQDWRRILDADPSFVEAAMTAAVQEIVKAVVTTGARLLLVSEYPSWRHRDCGLDGIHRLSTQMLGMLARRLQADPARSTAVVPSVDPEMQWLVSSVATERGEQAP